MKKKLLSLVLAGAMVASTSVSAFATTNTTESVGDGIINGPDNKDYTTNVKIEGSVQSTVKKKNEITSEKRTSVSLWVQGELGTAYLSSTQGSQNTGIYSEETLATELTEKKLLTVSKQSNKDLTLAGEAGQGEEAVTNPVSDSFTLVLKIKKSDGQ